MEVQAICLAGRALGLGHSLYFPGPGLSEMGSATLTVAFLGLAVYLVASALLTFFAEGRRTQVAAGMMRLNV